jgi:hypothetical protein
MKAITCCMSMIKAQEDETDHESYGALISYMSLESNSWPDGDGFYLGGALPKINFCPWCGKEIAK